MLKAKLYLYYTQISLENIGQSERYNELVAPTSIPQQEGGVHIAALYFFSFSSRGRCSLILYLQMVRHIDNVFFL